MARNPGFPRVPYALHQMLECVLKSKLKKTENPLAIVYFRWGMGGKHSANDASEDKFGFETQPVYVGVKAALYISGPCKLLDWSGRPGRREYCGQHYSTTLTLLFLCT